jgi:hypothetical protein
MAENALASPRRTLRCHYCQSTLVLPLAPELFDKIASRPQAASPSAWVLAWQASSELARTIGWFFSIGTRRWACPDCVIDRGGPG